MGSAVGALNIQQRTARLQKTGSAFGGVKLAFLHQNIITFLQSNPFMEHFYNVWEDFQ